MSLPVIIFDNSKVYYLNDLAKKLIKLSNTNLNIAKLKPFEFIHPDFHKRIKTNNTKILKGELFGAVELKIKDTRGNFIDIEAKSNRVNFNGKNAILSVFYNITERKAIVEELKQAKFILNLIGNNKTDIIFKCDCIPTNCISYISDSVYTILGYKPDYFYNSLSNYFKLFISNNKNVTSLDVANYKKSLVNNKRVITKVISKGNKEVWLETIHSLVKNKKGEIVSILGVSRDITKEKQTEAKLETTQNQLGLIAENSHDIIYFYTYQPKPKYLFISNSIKKVLGYSAEQLYRDPFFLTKKSVGKNNPFRVSDKITGNEQKKGKLKAGAIEFQIKNANGESVWVEDTLSPVYDEKGKISFLFGIIRNIEKLKNKEKELEDKWSDYKKLFDVSPVAFFIHHNGICLRCNQAAQDILKIKKQSDLIGTNLMGYISPLQQAQATERMRPAMEGQEFGFIEYKIVNSKGIEFDVELKTVPIVYNGISCTLTLAKDISEREIIEKSRIRAEETERYNKKLIKEIDKRIVAEKRVIEQKNKLIALVETSAMLVWTIDKNYRLTFFNKNYETILFNRFKKLPAIGKTVFEDIPKKDLANYKAYYVNNYDKVFKGERLRFEGQDIDVNKKPIYWEFFFNPIFSADNQVHEISCMATNITEKKSSEAKSIEQASRIKAIFDSGKQIIWTVDENYNYTSFNQKYAESRLELFGSQPVIGESMIYVSEIPKSIREFWVKKYQEVAKNKSVEFVTERKTLKGETIFRQFYLNPILNAENKVIEVSGIGKDITERTITQSKITEQAAKLNAIFEGSSHFMWSVDKNLHLTAFNKKYISLIKSIYDTIPVIGFKLDRGSMLIDKAYVVNLETHYARVFKGHKENFELELIDRNNKKVYLDVFLSPIYNNKHVVEISGIAHDVTEKRNAIIELKESEERSKAIINSIPDILFTLNKNGVFLDFKSEDKTKLFYKPEEFIGKSIHSLFKGKLGEDFHSNITEAIETGIIQDYNYTYIHNSSANHYESRFIKINEEDCLVLIRDITDTKNNAEKLTQSLKEKEVLLKEVHHRVKNNMQIISSILNLQSSYTTDAAILNLLRESQNRIKTMAYIHESLYQNKTFASINFNEYLSQLTSNIIHSFSVSPEKMKLITNCEKTILNIDVSIPLGLIINELVTNSIKHAFPASSKGVISINLKTENKCVFLTIEDNGIGVSSDLKPENSGSLGLQLVYTLVDQIGGKIKFESTKPHGTKVSINFFI